MLLLTLFSPNHSNYFEVCWSWQSIMLVPRPHHWHTCWLNSWKVERTCITCPRVIGQPKKVLRRKRGNALLGRVRVLGQAPRSTAEMGIWVHVTNWGSTLRTEGEWRKLERAETGVKQRCGVSRTLVQPDPMGSSGSASSTTEWALPWDRDWPFVAIAISYDSRLHPEGEC